MSGPYDDTWDAFVVRHTHPLNVAFHALSAVTFVAAPALALAQREPLWLLVFFGSGLIAVAGHLLSGEAVDALTVRRATSSLEVVVHVGRMCVLLARGRWTDEVRRATAR